MSVQASSPAGPAAVDRARVRFVLSAPQFGGNVGSAARALKNLGFTRLVLVRPACDPLGREARMMAVEAADVLERAVVARDLDEALAGAHTVVGTSRRTGKHRRPHWRLDALAPELAGLAATGEVAVVFGREDHGLADDELDRCTHLVHLAAALEYPSFNLAQAVLLVAYELYLAWPRGPEAPALDPPAEHGAREAMYLHLQRALLAIGFLSRDTEEPIMRRLRRLLGRAAMTELEVKLLRGIARQALWAGRQARAKPDAHADRHEPAACEPCHKD